MVEQILLKECSKFSFMKSACQNLVKDNSDKLVDLLAKELTPDQICHELKVCVHKPQELDIDEAIVVNVVAVPVSSVPSELVEQNPAQCTECNKIITEVQKLVTKDMNKVKVYLDLIFVSIKDLFIALTLNRIKWKKFFLKNAHDSRATRRFAIISSRKTATFYSTC